MKKVARYRYSFAQILIPIPFNLCYPQVLSITWKLSLVLFFLMHELHLPILDNSLSF